MSRIRSIKPSFFRDLTIAGLPFGARLTFIGLWTHVDDSGRAVDDPRLIKADVWPLDDIYTAKKVAKDIDMLIEAGRVCRYEQNGASYIHVVNWGHQYIQKRMTSVIPPCPLPEHYGSATVPLPPSPDDMGGGELGSRNRNRNRKGPQNASHGLTAGVSAKDNTEPNGSNTESLARRRIALDKAAAECGQCDHGWVDGPTGGHRCECQTA